MHLRPTAAHGYVEARARRSPAHNRPGVSGLSRHESVGARTLPPLKLHPKVAAGGAVAALVIAVFALFNIHVSQELAVVIAAALPVIAGYWKHS